jgi:hypothetical protein
MKKSLLITALTIYSINIFGVNIVTQENMSPEQLKTQLTEKYQGKINGFQTLARLTPNYNGLMMFPLKSKIDEAITELIAAGQIDLDKVETGIEQTLHSNLLEIFKTSIATAEKAAPHEVSKDLFAISPWNKKVVWNNAQTHVLMLTWIPAAYRKTYDDALNSGQELLIGWDAWVTAVPEVKEFTQEYVKSDKSGFNLTDRVEQFLGLLPSKPPYSTTQNKLFVEMWVKPEDLDRPCLDGEIVDSECTIDPHESDLDNLPPVYRDMSKLIPMTPEHKAWFEKEKKGKYTGDWAMPWTRFGYTYDWGSAIKSLGKRAAKGASEYLIKKNSKVMIHSLIPTDDYPNIPTPVSGYIYKG